MYGNFEDWTGFKDEKIRDTQTMKLSYSFDAYNIIFIILFLSLQLGIAGLIWALFWYCSFSDIPLNDPRISESENTYLEGNIPLIGQTELKVGFFFCFIIYNF